MNCQSGRVLFYMTHMPSNKPILLVIPNFIAHHLPCAFLDSSLFRIYKRLGPHPLRQVPVPEHECPGSLDEDLVHVLQRTSGCLGVEAEHNGEETVADDGEDEIETPAQIVDADFRELGYNKPAQPVCSCSCCGTTSSPGQTVDLGIVDPGDLGEGGTVEEVIEEEHTRRH